MKKIRIKPIIAICLASLIAFGMFGCGRKVNDMDIVNQLIEGGQEDVMLFDYFQQVVGTEEKQGYYEIVLYAIVDEEGKMSTEEIRMDVYTDGGLRTEKMVSSTVPYAMFDAVMEIIKEHKVKRWETMDESKLGSIVGCNYVCKFPAGEKYMRISSEAMPEDGMEVFNAILEALQAEYSAEN